MTAGSSVVSVLAGVVRMKVLAVVIGTSGLGLYGVLSQLLSTTSVVALVGLNTSGVRALAAAGERSAAEQARVSAAVRRVAIGAALLVATALVALSPWLAEAMLGQAGLWPDVAWLALGILAAALAAPLTISLQARRDIPRLALVTALAAIASTAATIALAFWAGAAAVAAMVVAIPCATLLVAWALARPERATAAQRPIPGEAWALFRFGAGVMAAGFATTGAILLARAIIVYFLGLDASGLFHAMWVISMSYIGFALTAMSAEYFPRLSSVANDPAEVNAQVNEQIRLVLLMATPVLVAVIGFSHPLLRILFSDPFVAVADALRWQIIGDFFKLCSWPVGFIFLAHQRTRAFAAGELIWAGTFVAGLWLLVPRLQLPGAGIAYLIGYLVYFIAALMLARAITGFVPERRTMGIVALTLSITLATTAIAMVAVDGHSVMAACVVVSTAICWTMLFAAPRAHNPLRSLARKVTGRG